MDKIKIIKNEKSWIETSAIEQVKQVAQLEGMIKAVGLPDLHVGKTPVGASFITKDIIYPYLIGSDIGCGMALFSTGIKRSRFKRDSVMYKLKNIKGIENIDITTFLENVNLPYKEKLGTIGSGNHFAELQEVSEIYDLNTFSELSMEKNMVYLLVHSGSRNYGEYIFRKYLEEYSGQKGLEKGSNGFDQYMIDQEKAIQFGVLNRELIAYRILNVIHGKEEEKILDSVHNSIERKEIQGETCYIHRKGTAPSDIGCVVIAGSRRDKSYIVKPAEGLEEYAFSVSHGAGRKWSRIGCKEKLENLYLKKNIPFNRIASNLIYEDRSVLYEEAPEAYKNIERVIEDMVTEKMISLVASLNPLITYKV